MGERGLSAGDALLIFLGSSSGIEGWVQLRGAKVAARGKADDALPPLFASETGEPLRAIAIAPGEQVLLHWLELPSGLAPAQAVAAARLMAAGTRATARAFSPSTSGPTATCISETG